MLAAGAGISERAESLGAAEDALRQALAPLGGRQADLLLFFATTHHAPHLEAIHDRLTQVAGTERVVGCSGGGVLAGRREVEEGPGAVVLALAADGLQVHAFHDPGFGDDNRESGRRIGAVVGQAARDNPLLVAFPDPYTMRGTEFLAGVADHGGRLPMVGGAAAHDGTHPRTYQLGPAGVTSHGVSGVLLSGPLRHTVGLSQACHPLCPPEVVTAAEGNRIDEIGGRPAMEVLAALLREQGILQFPAAAGLIFLAVPLDPADATLKAGRYTARNLLGLDPNTGSILAAEAIQPGQAVAFALREPSRTLKGMQRMVEGEAAAWRGGGPALGLYVNCCGRGRGLYRRPGRDAAIISSLFPGLPVAGFFSFAELAPVDQANRLHNYSGILTLMGEK